MWNLERRYWWTYLQGSSQNADMQNRLVDRVGEGKGGRNWETSVEIHTLPYGEQSCCCLVTQSLNHVWLFVTPWSAAHQAALSSTNSWSLLKLMSIETVMPSSHLSLCHPLLLLTSAFLSIRVNSLHQYFGGQNIGVSASASVLPMNIQDWFPSG